MLGDQVFDQANAFQAGAGAQRLGHLVRVDAGHVGYGGIGLRRIVDLELHQNAAHVALVAGQRAIQQQCALGLVELQKAGQRVDIFFDQGRLALQRMAQPFSGHRQHGNQILGLVFGVFIEEEIQRRFIIGAAPGAVAGQKFGSIQRLVAAP